MKDANRCQNSPPLNKQPSCWEQQLDPLKKLALPFNAEARSTTGRHQMGLAQQCISVPSSSGKRVQPLN